jgi:adenine-specific DNA-methyltransferase
MKPNQPKVVETITHDYATRVNLPSAEMQPVMKDQETRPVEVRYSRSAGGLDDEKEARNRDLDPQLVWRGKDEQDLSDLVVHAPPLYIQEKIHPKALIDELRRGREHAQREGEQPDLFADFNGIPEGADKTEFYQHEANWQNRMILGDSLYVMASLAEREGLRGKVQCIYIDPPYGIKFNSNFQWSTTSRTVLDGRVDHITREPEQVKAYRDTWRDGIHSYLTYLRDRLIAARELLHMSGSIFVQIGEENVHRVRTLMDETLGSDNYISEIAFHATSGSTSDYLSNPKHYLIWYARDIQKLKFRRLFLKRGFDPSDPGPWQFVEIGQHRHRIAEFLKTGASLDGSVRIIRLGDATSQRQGREAGASSAMGFPFVFEGRTFRPSGTRGWSSTEMGLQRAAKAGRLYGANKSLSLIRYFDESPYFPLNASWEDTGGTVGAEKIYVVQTNTRVVQRCLQMATDPGDLVLDPTCGSGTTAYVAEQWGRRWITIDTSRVALALARGRIMGARYPLYLLADSQDGQKKEAELQRRDHVPKETFGNVRQGFVCERVPHITLKSIANNTEIDVIWERHEARLAPLRDQLSAASQQTKTLEEWEIPRERPEHWPPATDALLSEFWELRIARQKEIDASIAANADIEYLYDKPYEDKKKVRVAGPFTVESLSPHRALVVDENDELLDPAGQAAQEEEKDFVQMILANLKVAGVQQAHREDKIDFIALQPWPGHYICAEGTYMEGETMRRAGIFIGPEFGTVPRPDLVAAAREAAEADFDVLISCAFNYEALSADLDKLGRIPVLKARINADMHMSEDLKNTGKGNLFVIFGEPDIDILEEGDRIRVKLNGVDVFKPQLGKVESSDPDEIACWFIDTDYDEESFFARHAYFLGANDPYKALKTTLKAEIDEEAWASLHSDTSRPFPKPASGRIAVKVINHLGDEVMKVFRV